MYNLKLIIMEKNNVKKLIELGTKTASILYWILETKGYAQFVQSYRSIAKEMNTNHTSIINSFHKLEKLGYLTVSQVSTYKKTFQLDVKHVKQLFNE